MIARALCVAALLATAQAALADDAPTEKARAYFERGRASYKLGEFQDAIREFEAGYQTVPRPLFLYNIANSARRANQPEKALENYRKYLVALPGAPERREVEGRIVEMETMVAERKLHTVAPPVAIAPPPPPERPPVVEAPTPPTPRQEAQPLVTPPVAEAPAAAAPPASSSSAGAVEHPGRGKKIAGIVVAVAGVAALAGGIAAGVIARQAGDDLRAAARASQSFDPAVEARGKGADLASIALYAIGGAAVVAGIVTYVVGHREARRAARAVALTPLVGPGHAGASLAFTW